MSTRESLIKAHSLIEEGDYALARSMLESIATDEPTERLDVILALLVVLNQATETDQLLEVANEGIQIADKAGNKPVCDYLRARKSIFLLSALSTTIYRQKNLTLAAGVFEWFDFSLERDKREFDRLLKERERTEAEITSLSGMVIEAAEHETDHYSRGSLFSAIGDFYGLRYICEKLDRLKGGRIRSKFANLHFIRRWNLDMFLYDRASRREIEEQRCMCLLNLEKAIKEFELGGNKSEEAHAIYNLALNMKMFNRFRSAKHLVARARVLAVELQEKGLLARIEILARGIRHKNREMRDYVNELGLDLPQ